MKTNKTRMMVLCSVLAVVTQAVAQSAAANPSKPNIVLKRPYMTLNIMT